MRAVLGAIIKPMARLSLAAALALVAISAIQPLFSDSGDLLAAEAVPVEAELSLPQQAEPDEGGTGVNTSTARSGTSSRFCWRPSWCWSHSS